MPQLVEIGLTSFTSIWFSELGCVNYVSRPHRTQLDAKLQSGWPGRIQLVKSDSDELSVAGDRRKPLGFELEFAGALCLPVEDDCGWRRGSCR
jgi:hypothetical protein